MSETLSIKDVDAGQTVAELPQTLVQCHAVIALLLVQQGELLARVQQLEERLKLDSNNSSKPPSSNGPGQTHRAARRSSGAKRGAQPGHKGHNRAMLEQDQLDEVIDCVPPERCACGEEIAQANANPQRHQVFDVPSIRARVTEYRRYSGRCLGCGKLHLGELPAGVPRGQLGARALALVGMLGTRYHLTQGKTRDLMAQLLGLDFSVGAISQAQGKVAQALKDTVEEACAAIALAPAKHIDETRFPREGSNNWVWTISTPKLVTYSLFSSRARYVAQALLGEQPCGVVVSDRYGVYSYVDPQSRQVCWAHLLRDFTRIAERSGQAGRTGKRLLGLGCVLFRWRNQGKAAAAFDTLKLRVRKALEQGQKQGCKHTAATCNNLLKLWPALWTFLDHDGVAPTNNDAEQALRTVVLKRKISGPTRSRRGDDFIGRGFSAHESCRRQGRALWEFLHQAMLAWIDGTAAPSLVPAPSG